MIFMNHARAEALRVYEGERFYRIEYRGFPKSLLSEMAVHVKYRFPDSKEFTIVSQSGSKLLFDRVLKRLLESEKEAVNQDNRTRIELTPSNYSFSLVGVEPDTGNYVLGVLAKTKNKFLYNGKVWIDAKDYTVTRIEAEPAKNPSFWIKSTEIKHTYEKVGDFWLPFNNQSISRIRMGGRAVLTIDYKDYRITEARPLQNQPGRESQTSSRDQSIH